MRLRFLSVIALGGVAMVGGPAFADPIIYNNLTPNNQIAIATSLNPPGGFDIETADDFFLNTQTFITSASFVGLIVPSPGGTPAISEVIAEMYRIFPLD